MTRKPSTKKYSVRDPCTRPLSASEAADPIAILKRLRGVMGSLAVYCIECDMFSMLGAHPKLSEARGMEYEAAILVNRIGYDTVLLYGAVEPTKLQHWRDCGTERIPVFDPPSMSIREVQYRLVGAIAILADIATNQVIIDTMRSAQAGERMALSVVLQHLEGLTGTPDRPGR